MMEINQTDAIQGNARPRCARRSNTPTWISLSRMPTVMFRESSNGRCS